jgi:hypothetical protein
MKDSRSSPEKSSVISPVPGGRVDHVWCENVDDDGGDVIGSSTHCDGLDLESPS